MNEKTNLTVCISKEVKHKAKIKAVTNKMTLKEYVEKVIINDIEGNKNVKMD